MIRSLNTSPSTYPLLAEDPGLRCFGREEKQACDIRKEIENDEDEMQPYMPLPVMSQPRPGHDKHQSEGRTSDKAMHENPEWRNRRDKARRLTIAQI